MTAHPVSLALALALLLSPAAALAQFTVAHDFSSGQPARASEVNENFDDVEGGIDAAQAAADAAQSSADAAQADADTALLEVAQRGFEYAVSTQPFAPDNATHTVVAQLTLSAPGAGFVSVDWGSYVTLDHVQGDDPTASDTALICAITLEALGDPGSSNDRLPGSLRVQSVESEQATDSYDTELSTSGVHPVASAGDVTFFVACRRQGASGITTIQESLLRATFHADPL